MSQEISQPRQQWYLGRVLYLSNSLGAILLLHLVPHLFERYELNTIWKERVNSKVMSTVNMWHACKKCFCKKTAAGRMIVVLFLRDSDKLMSSCMPLKLLHSEIYIWTLREYSIAACTRLCVKNSETGLRYRCFCSWSIKFIMFRLLWNLSMIYVSKHTCSSATKTAISVREIRCRVALVRLRLFEKVFRDETLKGIAMPYTNSLKTILPKTQNVIFYGFWIPS